MPAMPPASRLRASILFCLRTAWRDTRRSRRRLLLYTSSITLGIAALVAIASLGDSLRRAVQGQSAALLGADLVVSSRQPFTAAAEAWFATLGGRQTRTTEFSSMAFFPRPGRARLLSVRAVEDAFPLYGILETEPASAAREFRDRPAALVEESVLLQFGVHVGDEVRLGAGSFTIAGALRKVPGESPGFSLIAPRLVLPARFLADTQLLQRGSRLLHRAAFAFPDGTDVERIVRENRPKFDEWGVRAVTVRGREMAVGRAIENAGGFLGLIGFVALLLGAVGVASGIHVFIRQKLASVATLRCLGATVRQTFAIYLVQAAALGVVGAVAGAVLGIGVARLAALLPGLLGQTLPVEVELAVSWPAVGQGIAAGLGVTLALALLPLLAVRRVPPLLALRSTIEPPRASWRDPAVLAVVAGALAAITVFAVRQAAQPARGVAFVVATGAVFATLAGLGCALRWLVRRLMPARAPYVWRQGLANLFRPDNRTLLLILALGHGTFLVMTMQLTQGMLVRELELTGADNRSNAVLFDIQADEREDVRAIVAGQGLPVIEDLPLVTMRLASVKGVPVAELRRDPASGIPRWVLNREFRSTYRREPGSAERVVAGRWIGEVGAGTAVVPVSVESGIAEDLRLKVGDRLAFDVQGVPVECEVASLRAVEWRRVQPNFFVVFPAGVLEEAPHTVVMATHFDNEDQSAHLQAAVLEKHPSVSVIDLTLVLRTVESVLEKLGFVFRFMAAFVVGTGLIVLAGVMAGGRFQRLRETVLLRTLGASRRQIARIQLVEYWLLGSLAALAGVGLAWVASLALGRWVFEVHTSPEIAPMLLAWAAVSLLTVATGWLSGRRLLDHPPLEVLREEN